MAAPLDEVAEYTRQRRDYYERFPHFWATFPDDSGIEEEYAIYGAMDVCRSDVTAVRHASSKLFGVLNKVAQWVQVSPDGVLLQLGFHPSALTYARLSLPGIPSTVIGRFEFAMTAQGPKLLEFNAETPSVVVELFSMNSQVCRDFGLPDPNAQCEAQLALALGDAVRAGLTITQRADRRGHVVFTSWGEHREDRGTVEYLRSILPAHDAYEASYCPLDELVLTADALHDREGRPIEVLYKLYPTEHLLGDESLDHIPVGRMIMGLVCAGRLVVINPPVSFVLQNKALLALSWGLHEARAPFFSEEEHEWIARFMVPTYLETSDERGESLFTGTYVAKPIYGREGDSIRVLRPDSVIEVNPLENYVQQMYTYQQYVELPRTTLLTEGGKREVNLVFNCFVVGGEPSAVGIRAGSKLILDDNAYFVPICYSVDS